MLTKNIDPREETTVKITSEDKIHIHLTKDVVHWVVIMIHTDHPNTVPKDKDMTEILYFENYNISDIVTPIKHEVLQQLLSESNYDSQKSSYLVYGFKQGFQLGYRGPTNRQDKSQNILIHMRLPIRKSLLNILLKKIEEFYDGSQVYLTMMYQTLFYTAYFGLFRVDEITLSSNVLKAKDVKIATNKKKVKFILRTSKTHGIGDKPQIIKISCEGEVQQKTNHSRNATTTKCPLTPLQEYIQIRKRRLNDNEPFFIFQDRSPVKPDHFRNMLKRMIEMCGLDSTLYGCHSTRSGRAIDLVEIYHLDIVTVKKLGHWKSNIVYQYLTDL